LMWVELLKETDSVLHYQKDILKKWVDRGIKFAITLPPK